MNDRRLILALGRLERALTRVEAGLDTQRQPLTHDESEALFRLAERHRTLREATEQAIERIDRLLGQQLMADVDVTVGGRRYTLSCRDGEEEQLRSLAKLVDQKAADITRAIGEMTETRTLLLSALLIADELNDMRAAAARVRAEPPPEAEPDPAYAIAIERIAERVERLVNRLDGAAE